MQRSLNRRRFLQGTALVGIPATGGCLSARQSNSAGTETDQSSGNATDSRPTTGSPQGTESATPSADLQEWFVDTENFDGTVVDRTDAETVKITVGAKSGDRHLAFDPPAVQITAGTTVKWTWTGEGGGHNVVFPNGDISSSQIHARAGTHFQHTFEQSGTFRYRCKPHADFGQKGAILVL
jgi:halocyanin-like protein